MEDEEIPAFLKCPRCSSEFSTDSTSQLAPRVVPCGHFVCGGCYAKACQSDYVYKCATCDRECFQGSLPVYKGIIELLEKLRPTEEGKPKLPSMKSISAFSCHSCTSKFARDPNRCQPTDSFCGHYVCIGCASKRKRPGKATYHCNESTCNERNGKGLVNAPNMALLDLMDQVEKYIESKGGPEEEDLENSDDEAGEGEEFDGVLENAVSTLDSVSDTFRSMALHVSEMVVNIKNQLPEVSGRNALEALAEVMEKIHFASEKCASAHDELRDALQVILPRCD